MLDDDWLPSYLNFEPYLASHTQSQNRTQAQLDHRQPNITVDLG